MSVARERSQQSLPVPLQRHILCSDVELRRKVEVTALLAVVQHHALPRIMRKQHRHRFLEHVTAASTAQDTTILEHVTATSGGHGATDILIKASTKTLDGLMHMCNLCPYDIRAGYAPNMTHDGNPPNMTLQA